MLNSDKKNKYSNSPVVRKKDSERNHKIHTPPPPCKLNGRSLIYLYIYIYMMYIESKEASL